MKVPVLYVADAYAAVTAKLREIVGAGFSPGVFPFAALPIPRERETAYAASLAPLLAQCSPGSAVVFHAEQQPAPTDAHVRAAVMASPELDELLADYGAGPSDLEIKMLTQEHCTAVLAIMRDRAGMPPGMVLLVDHAGLQTFPRRLVDAGHLFFDWEEPPLT